MTRMLQNKDIDVAVALTEGVILKIANDVLNGSNQLAIGGSWTMSSLVWSIAIHPDSTIGSIQELQGKRIGISRFGSGSHIIAHLLALENKFDIEFEYVVMKDFKGLRSGIESGQIDAFLWELVTTKPWYDDFSLKLLDVVKPPWPSFLLAVDSELELAPVIKGLQSSLDYFEAHFLTRGIDYIKNSEIFHYPNEQDLIKWKNQTVFSKNIENIEKEVGKCLDLLVKAELIDRQRLGEWEAKNGPLMKRIMSKNVKFKYI